MEPFYLKGIEEQPMTYGLILSAEVLRFRSSPNEEGRRRIRKAVQWLLENADSDGDGLPGWGLPQAWDAFADGSVNKAHHPYSITTAIVLLGLQDALSTPSLWTNAEKEAIRKIVINVSTRWAKDVWTEDANGGFFWYSPSPSDAHFVPNVSAMFLGSLARLLHEQGDFLNDSERKLIQDRVDKAAQSIVSKVLCCKH